MFGSGQCTCKKGAKRADYQDEQTGFTAAPKCLGVESKGWE